MFSSLTTLGISSEIKHVIYSPKACTPFGWWSRALNISYLRIYIATELQNIENKFRFGYLEGWLAKKFVHRFKITFAFFIKGK